MVINTRYKFIFVHIPKAAGTSVMAALSSLDGNHTRWLAGTKHETLGEMQTQFMRRRSWGDRLWCRSPRRYFRFGFVRNPWDRMASFYRYLSEKPARKGLGSLSSFREFLVQARDGVEWIRGLHSMRPQVDFFTFGGRMELDYLGHFESLQSDLRRIERHIGCRIDLPHLNRSSNTGKDYRAGYDSEMIEIVADLFADDIRHFGYAFDHRHPARPCSAPLDRRR